MRQILARKDLVQLGEIEIGSWRYRYGSLFLSQLRLSPKQFANPILPLSNHRSFL
jgi:hypothetical protein